MTELRLATRGSKLALWQSQYIQEKLAERQVASRLVVVKTTGDIVQDKSLSEIGGKGVFAKEIEESLLEHSSDLAMHSLKDLPVTIKDPFVLSAIMKRHSVRDLLILNPGKPGVSKLLENSILTKERFKSYLEGVTSFTVATSSLRRKALLGAISPKIQCVDLRGNVDTRLAKLQASSWDAIILAEASMDRLSIKTDHMMPLDPLWFVPCAGQGALAVEVRKDDQRTFELTAPLNCKETALCTRIERLVLKALGGDCNMPFGCLVTRDDRDRKSFFGQVIVLYPPHAVTGTMDESDRYVSGRFSIHETLIGDGRPMANGLLATLDKRRTSDILRAIGVAKFSFEC